MKFADKLRDKAKEGGAPEKLSYHLHRVMSRQTAARSIKRIHASEVTKPDYCPRRFALMDKTGIRPKPETIGTCEEAVYEQGRALARMVVHWAANAGIAVGDWECLGCGTTYHYQGRPPACGDCKSKRFVYREIRVRSTVSGISGGLDLLVALPGVARHRLVEIKSIAKEPFKALVMPLAEHRLRTNLYLRCVAESDHSCKSLMDKETGIVLYVSKGGYGEKSDLPKKWGISDMPWTPFKEFTIERDDKETQTSADAAKMLYDYQQGGAMPGGICLSAFCQTAQRCEVRQQCFSGAHPAGKK